MNRFSFSVRKWMTARPVTTTPLSTLVEADDLMREYNVRRLPVVEEEGELVGIITRSDVERMVGSCETQEEVDLVLRATSVDEAMTEDPVTIEPDDMIQDAAETMLEFEISGLPVVDEERLVGIITESDIFRLVVGSEAEEGAGDLRTASPGWVLWLTGLPASGKTTLARHLHRSLAGRGVSTVVLDSDELRPVLTPQPTYSPEERDTFYREVAALAHLLVRNRVNVIIAATAPHRAHRQAARDLIPRFAEVWVHCPQEVCRERDPKGLYAGADAGRITNLPGVGDPYQVPEAAEVVVDTGELSAVEAADHILSTVSFLKQYAQRGKKRSSNEHVSRQHAIGS
jgi:adenylylsulfate kinase